MLLTLPKYFKYKRLLSISSKEAVLTDDKVWNWFAISKAVTVCNA